MKTIDIIKGNKAVFVECHSGSLVYEVNDTFRFSVPVKDLQGSRVRATENASVFMKWIKVAVQQINKAELENRLNNE